MGKSPRVDAVTDELTEDDPTVELDMLEETISIEGAQELRHDAHGLDPAPIPLHWVLEGNPIARRRVLVRSSGKLATTAMWDCTAGHFKWFYDEDEVTHVLEGSVVIEDAAGTRQRLQAGDTFLFRAGSTYQWAVPDYIRKIGFSYSPPPREMRVIKELLDRLTAPFQDKSDGTAAPDD